MAAQENKSWFYQAFFGLAQQLRWSFLPPLMVYFSYGVSGLTAIVGTFFVKDYLGLSAAFLAGLTFWAGLPWALKMPLGHLVDLMWRWKTVLIFIGAGLIAASLGTMYLLITQTAMMEQFLPRSAWYVIAVLLSPCGYVVQDVVADAMSIEAVPVVDETGRTIPQDEAKLMHTTMQTLGRFALISGTVGVALLNIFMFSGAETLADGEKIEIYGRIYLIAMVIPVLSVSGVALAAYQRRLHIRALRAQGVDDAIIARASARPGEPPKVNHWYFTGGLAFVVLTLTVGLSGIPFGQELIFTGSMAVVLFLIFQLTRALKPAQARALFGTALIIFVFRAIPSPGPGYTWFSIDQLGFDEQFLSVLSLIISVLTLAGIILLRPMMVKWPITSIVILLSIAAGVLSLPNIGLYFGIHEWSAPRTGGLVDARFIAILDTAAESPLGQVAMIPMLAWIARNAPAHLKATFFAVMASFTNLALSASSLGTKYLNQIFEVTREVREPATGAVTVPADYSQLGVLLIAAAILAMVLPLVTIWLVQRSRYQTPD